MALIFQAVLYAVEWVRRWFGSAGVLLSAAGLGLTDVDALTYAMTRFPADGAGGATAAQALAVGVLANMASQRPSAPLVTPSTPAVRTHVAPQAPLPLPFPTTTACSHPRWLRPRRHAEQQHLTQRPDVIRQSRGHRRRPWLPALGRARAVGRLGLGQRLA